MVTFANKQLIKKNGLEFVTAYVSSAGVADTDVDSVTISLYTSVNGERVVYVDAASMTEGDNGVWAYVWSPSRTPRIEPGSYTVEYAFTKGSDTFLLFDELSIDTSEYDNNATWYSSPQSGKTFRNPAPSANWP